MKIVFLLSHVPDPRMNKRITVAKRVGNVSVIYVNRKNQDIFTAEHTDVIHEKIDIDLPPSSQIFKRFVVSQRYKHIALSKLTEHKPDVIYTEGLDSLDIAVNYKRKSFCHIFYEVADLRESYIEKSHSIYKRLVVDLIKRKDKRLFRDVEYLIITSEKFYDAYYCNLIGRNKTLFVPNTPNFDVFRNYQKKSDGDFTIGFIGGIRYLQQMQMLVDAAKIAGCKVLFAGAGGTNQEYNEISEYCKDKDYVKFTGKYNYSKDIARLYGSVDCVYAVYDADNANVRIALPNKLYESVYCCLPLIVSKGTYLSDLVIKWGVGVSISHKDVNELIEALKALRVNEKLREIISENCKNIRQKVSGTAYNEALEKCFLKFK